MTPAFLAHVRGIDLYGGAHVVEAGESGMRGACGIVVSRGPHLADQRVWWLTGTPGVVTSVTHGTVLDLRDPNTLATFDRRLARRWGAPPAAVAEGVIFARFARMDADDLAEWVRDNPGEEPEDGWRICAGRNQIAGYPEVVGFTAWDHAWPTFDTDDALLARAIAWNLR
jgi:hypothetical protein